jgi:hypothetical protein
MKSTSARPPHFAGERVDCVPHTFDHHLNRLYRIIEMTNENPDNGFWTGQLAWRRVFGEHTRGKIRVITRRVGN